MKEGEFPRSHLTKRKKPHKMDALTTLKGRKTEFPASREPADAASRWGSSVDDCSRSCLPEREVGRDGGPVTAQALWATEGRLATDG